MTSKYNKNVFEKENITREKMINLYHIKDMSTKDIGEKYGVTRGTVGRWLKDLNIPTKKMIKCELSKLSKEQMYKWYIEERLSFRQIMKKLRTKSNRKIKRLLDEYNIPARHGSEAIKTQWEDNDKRKNKIGKIFGEYNKGKPPPTKLSKKEIIKRTQNNNFIYIEHYLKNQRTFVKYKCTKCGYIGKKYLSNLGRNGCPGCNSYKGENRIKHFLDSNSINYKIQYTFKDCKHKGPLKFDFAIFNGNIVDYLVEYDGRFHFEVVSELRSEQDFVMQRKRDIIKNNYCEENNINLIRIPYWKYDEIENILEKEIDLIKCKNKQLSLFDQTG